MTSSTLFNRLTRLGIYVLVAVVLAAVLYVTSNRWLPVVQDRLAPVIGLTTPDALQPSDPHPETAAAHVRTDDHPHGKPNVIRLSDQARQSLGIRVEKLKFSDFERTLKIPAQVVKIPGVTDLHVTALASGEVSRIHVLEGHLVQPGEPLFDIELIHEEAIQVQLELLDALAKREIVGAEIRRLELLESRSPGAIPGKRLLEQRYEQGRLEHTVSSRRQVLLLLGLSRQQVDSLIHRHRQHHDEQSGNGSVLATDNPLLERITIYAPQPVDEQPDSAPVYVMEELTVALGQHVDVGNLLCHLSDFRRLYIEGRSFERDLQRVRRAMDQSWTAKAVVEQPGRESLIHDNLRLLYLDPSIDAESRSARFYVEIHNQLRKHSNGNGRDFADWQYRPGQRVELRVPVEKFQRQFVIPVNAVVRDGVENYAFQASGNTLVRRPVTVVYRDDDYVVIADDGSVFEGMSVAMSGAYQLQLSLTSQKNEPDGHHHGGAPHAH